MVLLLTPTDQHSQSAPTPGGRGVPGLVGWRSDTILLQKGPRTFSWLGGGWCATPEAGAGRAQDPATGGLASVQDLAFGSGQLAV